jgi:hypothetical protein
MATIASGGPTRGPLAWFGDDAIVRFGAGLAIASVWQGTRPLGPR